MQRFRPKQHRRNGFSLIELSVVIAIVSIVAVLGLESMAIFMNRTAYRVTQERMAVIKEALAKHRYVYGYIPCPAWANTSATYPSNDYGKEYRNSGTGICSNGTMAGSGNNSIHSGDVPVRDLGLPAQYMKDGYGSRIRYIVSRPMTRMGTTANLFGNEATVGLIKIRTGLIDPAQSQQIATAAYVLLSYGADKRGAYGGTGCMPAPTTKFDGMIDTVNCRNGSALTLKTGTPAGAGTTVVVGDDVFYDSRYNNGSNEEMHFDDIIVWQTKGQL